MTLIAEASASEGSAHEFDTTLLGSRAWKSPDEVVTRTGFAGMYAFAFGLGLMVAAFVAVCC